MSRPQRRRAAVALATAVLPLMCAAASSALADSGTTSAVAVTFGAETWYQPDLTCRLPTGCTSTGVTLPAINPYGAGTLHVSVSAGQETGRTYLNLKATPVPATMTLASATFTAPLDTSTTHGSVAPETSTTQVCASTASITADEGEFDDPPTDTSCAIETPLTYTATPTPELTGDVTQLLEAHLTDLAAGTLDLAVLPYDFSATATWHDVFSSDDRTSDGPAAPTLSLTFTTTGPAAGALTSAAPTATPARASGSPAAPPAVATAGPGRGPVTDGGPAAPMAIMPAPEAQPSESAPPPQVASAVAPPTRSASPAHLATAASTGTAGFAYPAVLLLPLVLLAGAFGLARIMTRDVTPTRPRP